MTLASMALLASVIGERISGRWGPGSCRPSCHGRPERALLARHRAARRGGPPAVRARAVRPHGAGAAVLLLFPARHTGASYYWLLSLLRLAKLTEYFDQAPPAHGRERALEDSRPRRAPTGSSGCSRGARPPRPALSPAEQPRRPARQDRRAARTRAPVAQPVLLRTRELAERPREGGDRRWDRSRICASPGRVGEDAFDDPLHHGLLAHGATSARTQRKRAPGAVDRARRGGAPSLGVAQARPSIAGGRHAGRPSSIHLEPESSPRSRPPASRGPRRGPSRGILPVARLALGWEAHGRVVAERDERVPEAVEEQHGSRTFPAFAVARRSRSVTRA